MRSCSGWSVITYSGPRQPPTPRSAAAEAHSSRGLQRGCMHRYAKAPAAACSCCTRRAAALSRAAARPAQSKKYNELLSCQWSDPKQLCKQSHPDVTVKSARLRTGLAEVWLRLVRQAGIIRQQLQPTQGLHIQAICSRFQSAWFCHSYPSCYSLAHIRDIYMHDRGYKAHPSCRSWRWLPKLEAARAEQGCRCMESTDVPRTAMSSHSKSQPGSSAAHAMRRAFPIAYSPTGICWLLRPLAALSCDATCCWCAATYQRCSRSGGAACAAY